MGPGQEAEPGEHDDARAEQVATIEEALRGAEEHAATVASQRAAADGTRETVTILQELLRRLDAGAQGGAAGAPLTDGDLTVLEAELIAAEADLETLERRMASARSVVLSLAAESAPVRRAREQLLAHEADAPFDAAASALADELVQLDAEIAAASPPAPIVQEADDEGDDESGPAIMSEAEWHELYEVHEAAVSAHGLRRLRPGGRVHPAIAREQELLERLGFGSYIEAVLAGGQRGRQVVVPDAVILGALANIRRAADDDDAPVAEPRSLEDLVGARLELVAAARTLLGFDAGDRVVAMLRSERTVPQELVDQLARALDAVGADRSLGRPVDVAAAWLRDTDVAVASLEAELDGLRRRVELASGHVDEALHALEAGHQNVHGESPPADPEADLRAALEALPEALRPPAGTTRDELAEWLDYVAECAADDLQAISEQAQAADDAVAHLHQRLARQRATAETVRAGVPHLA